MDPGRLVDAYCERCTEVRRHRVGLDDPTVCRCMVCGAEQEIFRPGAMGQEEPPINEPMTPG